MMKKKLDGHIFIVCILLFIFFISSILSSLQESPISDEPGHIITGLMYVKQGDLTFNSGSPLLSNVISALPLSIVIRNSDIPNNPGYKQQGYLHSLAADFLTSNSGRIDLIMFLARFPSMLLGIGIGVLIYLWSKRMYGPTAGLFGLVLYCFNPNFLAHSHYATPDIALAFFFLLTLYSLYYYLISKRRFYLVIILLSFSAAQLVKNSAIYLFPIVLMIILFANKINRPNLIRLIKIGIGLILVSWLSINVFYGFHGLGQSAYWFLTHDQAFINSPYSINQVEKLIPTHLPIVGPIAQYVFREMPLFISYDYIKTIGWVLFRSQNGQLAYLFGNYSLHGWWYYYPVILLIKNTPLFLSLFFCSFLLHFSKKHHVNKYELLFFLLPSMGMLLLTMKSGIDTGIRQVLFIIPLLIIFTSRIISQLKARLPRIIILLLLLIQGFYVYLSFPNFISYFNVFAGKQNSKHLVASDSNIDWGQDVKKLSHYLKINNIKDIKMNLFGVMTTQLYGVLYQPYGPSWIKEDNKTDECEPLSKGLFAISATQITGVYLYNHQCFSWLNNKTPTKVIGSSIYIYSL